MSWHHPHFVDGKDGLQIWRIAGNILNKESQILQFGSWTWGITIPHHKKTVWYEMLHRALE
jgi:hypothetical protein